MRIEGAWLFWLTFAVLVANGVGGLSLVIFLLVTTVAGITIVKVMIMPEPVAVQRDGVDGG